MDFYFVRHGESANNVLFANEYPDDRASFEKVRSPNPDLTDQGRAQALLVGSFMRKVFHTGEHTLMGPTDPTEMTMGGTDESMTKGSDDASASGIQVINKDSWVSTPVGIDEIWSSYLARAIETGIAIQHGIANMGDKSTSSTVAIPTIRLNEMLTEVGGHYQYIEEAAGMVATPGYTNADVLKRWGSIAKFEKLPSRNDATGWNRRKQRETAGEGKERALAVIRLMESHAVSASLHGNTESPSSIAEATTPATTNINNKKKKATITVITHGDFFKQLITRLSIVGSSVSKENDDSEASSCNNEKKKMKSELPLDKGTVSVEGLAGEGEMFPTIRHCTRVVCPLLASSGSKKVRNTSINHLRCEFDPVGRELRWSSRFLDRMDHLEGTNISALQSPPSVLPP